MIEDNKVELDRLFAKLQKLKPVPKRLQVLCTDGDTRNIPVPASRQKWQKLRPLIAALDWVRCEAYSAKGEYQDGFESDMELEDLEGSSTNARDIAFYNAVARQVKLTQEAVKDALHEQSKQAKVLLDGAAKCVEVTTQALGALQRVYETRVNVLDAMVEEGAEGGGGLLSGKFLEVMGVEIAKAAAPQIIKGVTGKKNGKRAQAK